MEHTVFQVHLNPVTPRNPGNPNTRFSINNSRENLKNRDKPEKIAKTLQFDGEGGHAMELSWKP